MRRVLLNLHIVGNSPVLRGDVSTLHVKYQKTALSSFYELFLGVTHSQAVVLASFQ